VNFKQVQEISILVHCKCLEAKIAFHVLVYEK